MRFPSSEEEKDTQEVPVPECEKNQTRNPLSFDSKLMILHTEISSKKSPPKPLLNGIKFESKFDCRT